MEAYTDLQRLTLVFPPLVEAQLIELLLEQDPPLPGFTVLSGEGHGADFATASLREQVRGRVARRALTMVLPADRVGPLVTALRRAISNSQVTWWTEHVTGFGRFA
jgi:hypothetical protein